MPRLASLATSSPLRRPGATVSHPAAAAEERSAAAARDRDFKSPKTRGWLIGAAVSVTVVSVLLVILAGKKQKTGKWL